VVRSAVYTAVFFVLAPGTMAGLVPWLITGWDRPDHGVGPADVAEGRGTPAPVAPTEELVVGGLYRFVRNPMYLAVASVIAGQALLFRSGGVALWLAVFLAAVVSFVKGYEEPRLTEQFGASYERYRREVPGWWPRLTAYRG
jgi:phospholipid methyltransferase